MKSHEFLIEWVENPEFDKLWTKYVPREGEAKTTFGEAIRALGRLEYDYYNNGYGNARETEEPDYGSDDDEDEYDYGEGTLEDIGFNPYYEDLWNKLKNFVQSNNPTTSAMSAVDTLDTPAWDRSTSPKFEQAVRILKQFLVDCEPKKLPRITK